MARLWSTSPVKQSADSLLFGLSSLKRSSFPFRTGSVTNIRQTPLVSAVDLAGGVPIFIVLRAFSLLLLAFRGLVLPGMLRLVAPRRDPAAARIALRRALEAGGVTTIKIGQYLAIRRDLFSAETCAELSRLFDAVPAMPPILVRRIVERELGGPMERFFLRFERLPIGAASIAQVHRAGTADGVLVAVKVQRPGLAVRLTTDFRILAAVAGIADQLAQFGTTRAAALVAEIAAFTLREVDFRAEGETAARIGADPRSGVRVPAIHWALSTERLLVMDFIDAVPLARILAAADAGEPDAFARIVPGVAPAAIVDRLARAFLRQLFVTGLFHGDPHPANVLIARDGGIALIDFGIFGQLGRDDRATLACYVENLALGRIDAAFDCYARLVHPGPRTDFAAFRRSATAVLADWPRAAADPATPVALQLTARYQGFMFALMRAHHVRMDTRHLLFWRALGMLDSTAHRLPGDFNLLAAIRRFFADTRPTPAERIVRTGARLVETIAATTPEAIRAAATHDTHILRIESRLATADASADASPARMLALVLAGLACVLHAAALATGPW